MTHPVHSQTTLEALSTKELKTIASQIGAIPDGDKRVKQTWISAIIDHQTKFSPVKVAAMEAHIDTVLNRLEPRAAETEPIDSIQPTDKPIEELLIYPIELPADKPIEEPQLVEPTPILITVLAVMIILLCSIAIVPALVIGSIAISLGQPHRGISRHPIRTLFVPDDHPISHRNQSVSKQLEKEPTPAPDW
jgi:hypothetical protein